MKQRRQHAFFSAEEEEAVDVVVHVNVSYWRINQTLTRCKSHEGPRTTSHSGFTVLPNKELHLFKGKNANQKKSDQ